MSAFAQAIIALRLYSNNEITYTECLEIIQSLLNPNESNVTE
jgi:hypothetical protein